MVVVVILVVAGAIGGLSYYLNDVLPSTTSESTETTPTSTCSVSEPLSLVSAVAGMDSGYLSMSTVWSNCSNQQISFDISAGSGIYTLDLTVSTYGVISHVPASLASIGGVVDPHATTTVKLGIFISPSDEISPNAIIEGFSGQLTATDPASGQAISPTAVFTS